ncbi:MAG: hypothetical protein ACRDT6_00215 [Micromonosporaceae bacterium]
MKSFLNEAQQTFEFLSTEFGLAGPEHIGVVLTGVSFVAPGLRYRILLDDQDRTVITEVELETVNVTLTADLEDLVAASGIESRNRVPCSAQSLYSLRRALGAQAGLIRLLHPLIVAPGGTELMRKANARERHA